MARGDDSSEDLGSLQGDAEWKAAMKLHDGLVDLLMELAMERENDSNMDKYFRKHL